MILEVVYKCIINMCGLSIRGDVMDHVGGIGGLQCHQHSSPHFIDFSACPRWRCRVIYVRDQLCSCHCISHAFEPRKEFGQIVIQVMLFHHSLIGDGLYIDMSHQVVLHHARVILSRKVLSPFQSHNTILLLRQARVVIYHLKATL